ncbi:hypothetical protein BDY17DRAFT_306853 [Neohortaea acidophila]|uniref:Uncharacterized protein n=1 Tax=Neohortaea acidophila TaxID=245834 RepID=A0A6A6Q5X7_9PEZI|nr:uncharacterized protein BDY17DRAFT_306853 [Neohortaea acidophila]KAF2487471.1 hypothetical protein BDY17DRAFT_306853 [Neohortaea acidophila]
MSAAEMRVRSTKYKQQMRCDGGRLSAETTPEISNSNPNSTSDQPGLHLHHIMVTATRSRCYERDANDDDFYDHRPAKRRRVQEKPLPPACPSYASPSSNKRVDTTNDLGTAVTQPVPTQLLTPTSSTPTPSSARISASSAPKDTRKRKLSSPQVCSASPRAGALSAPTYDSIISSRASRPKRSNTRKQRGDPDENGKPSSVEKLEETTILEGNTTRVRDEALSARDTRNLSSAMGKSHESTLPRNDIARSSVAQDHFELPASASPTPSAPCTRPEHVYDIYDPNFGEEVRLAYKINSLGQSCRVRKYGAEVAEAWKRGSTPDEAREQWRVEAARQLAEAEEISDSD